jgi:anthranilate/para-aminobenzoate synthase component I
MVGSPPQEPSAGRAAPALDGLRFRAAGAPRSERLPALDGVDVHPLACALGDGCPALLETGGEVAGWHAVMLAPRGWLVSRDRVTRLDWHGLRGGRTARGAGGLDSLRALLARLAAPPPAAGDTPLSGGLVLLAAYDLAHEIERLPCTTDDRDGWPWLLAVACPAALVVDVASGEARLRWLPDAGGEPGDLPWGLSSGEVDHLRAELARAAEAPAEPAGKPRGDVTSMVSAAEHGAMVARVVQHLHAGDVYQANVSVRFEVEWQGSALPLFGVLRRRNPSPFSGWLRHGEMEVVVNSPERMVSLRGRELLTEPIKGTATLPLGPDTPSADVERARATLLGSAKDAAEHVMIVDIHRNDLGRVSAPGTVHVPRMMRVDRRSHVLQGIAEIRGTLREGAGPVDVIEAMFPAGSITGVPKVRAMEVLDALERYRRGPYTGSFGWIAAHGDLDLDVLIRSAWTGSTGGGERHLAFQAGGGIVLASEARAEHEECLSKARAMAEAVESLR